MSPLARGGTAILAAGLLTALSWKAARLGESGEAAYRAVKEIATWSASGAAPATQTVGWLAADLERARALAPGDPNIEEMLGSLALRALDRPGFLDEAQRHFVRAIAMRPTSPYAWANLAAVEYRQGQTGPSFRAALRTAALLGPAEPEVQRTVVDLGLALWDESDAQTRAVVERTITGAMQRDAAETLQAAQRRDRLAVACRHLADAPRRVDPMWRLLCRSGEATP